jgi:hypothetical protein
MALGVEQVGHPVEAVVAVGAVWDPGTVTPLAAVSAGMITVASLRVSVCELPAARIDLVGDLLRALEVLVLH